LRNAFKVLVRIPPGKRPLGGTRRRWEYNIVMDIGETGHEVVDSIQLAQDKV
jgi:hypothetical protein